MGNDWNNQFWCYVWLLQSLILKSSLLGKLFLVWFQLHLIIRWVILVLSRETKIFRDWLYVAWLKENVYNCLTCDCQEICIRIFNVLLDKKMKAWHLLFFFFFNRGLFMSQGLNEWITHYPEVWDMKST